MVDIHHLSLNREKSNYNQKYCLKLILILISSMYGTVWYFYCVMYHCQMDLPIYDSSFDCYRDDGVDLIVRWMETKPDQNRAKVVFTQAQLEEVATQETDFLLGLFGKSHVAYDNERMEGRDPTIGLMTRKALEILLKDKKQGFVLLVEGGRIDHAHHSVIVSFSN